MLLLYPGAGSDASHPSLVATRDLVAPRPCVLEDFPYRREGRKAPDRAPKLLASIRDDLDRHADAIAAAGGVILGGRSMGGRMCSLIAAGADDHPPPPALRGLVLVAYPLHPPGKPDRLRVEHLPDVRVPTLFVSGSRDTFGSPDELRRWSATMPARAKVRHIVIDRVGHGLEGCDHTIAGAIRDFADRLLGPVPSDRAG